MRKVLMGLILCIAVFWGCRIYSLNQVKEEEMYYDMSSTIHYGDLEIVPEEAHLCTPKEYEDVFQIKADGVEDGSMIISICLNVTNQSSENISWDVLMEQIAYGFETTTWASSIDPLICAGKNKFHSESFTAGATQKIWFETTISSSCFKKSHWEQIKKYEFYFVLSLEPSKIKIKMENME